jgi:hypothetical protein
MYLRGNPLRPSLSRYEDYGLAAAAGTLLAIFAGFVFGFYWLMQPTIVPNYGLAAYQPPPKTVVHYAKSPWVPPAPSEALPEIAVAEPVPESRVVEEPKSEVKTQEARTTPRRARPVREQPNPFFGFFSSSRPSGRSWF